MCNKSRVVKTSGFNGLSIATTLAIGLTGCTVDSLVVLRHPADVSPAAAVTFSVGFVNNILDGDSAQMYPGFGLP